MAPNSASGRRSGLGAAHHEAEARAPARGASLSPGANDVSASASRTAAADEVSTVSTVAAVSAPTPAPGPISTALRRSSREELRKRRIGADGLDHDGRQVRGVDAVAVAGPTT